MKLEVGMYVRTKFGISKIIEDGNVKVIKSDNEETYDVDKNGRHYPTQFRDYIWTSDVIKASHNIIDLIEVGDYVNGMAVVAIDSDRRLYVPEDLGQPYDREFSNGCFYHTLLDMDTFKITSIVTKEQFESISYKI